MLVAKLHYEMCILWLLSYLNGCLTAMFSAVKGGIQQNSRNTSIEAAFRYAVSNLNNNTKWNQSNNPEWEVQYLVPNDYHVTKTGECEVLAEISPTVGVALRHVRYLSSGRTISNMQPNPGDGCGNRHQSFLKMYPDPSSLNQAYIDIIQYFHWNKFCIIYGDEKDILQLQTVLTGNFNPNVEFIVRHASDTRMLKVLKEVKNRGITKLLVHLNARGTLKLLKTALLVGMIDASHHFLLTNLDIETISLDDFKHNKLNLVGFRMINRANGRTSEILRKMKKQQRVSPDSKILHSTKPPIIKINAAIMYDAVTLFADVVQKMKQIGTQSLKSDNNSCDSTLFKLALYELINLVEINGLTGKVTFDEGRRLDFRLDILELGSNGLTKVGNWESVNGTTHLDIQDSSSSLWNRTLLVTTLSDPPYIMFKSLGTKNDLEGFCIDLLAEISSLVGFQYKIHQVNDGYYGSQLADGKWNGLVGELVDKTADLSFSPLTITHAREKVIDFTVPFQKYGTTILLKRPTRESLGPFSFLHPLDLHVWIYIMTALLAVTIIMFFLAKLSPYEKNTPSCHYPWKRKSTVSHGTGNNAKFDCSEIDNRHDSINPDNPILRNEPHNINLDDVGDQAEPINNLDLIDSVDPYQSRFTLSDCFWFSLGTLMQQGSDINPRALSTRLVGITWWFFALIIITSYTANLAAFLTVDRMKMPIQNAEDLSKQTEIPYGIVSGGAIQNFIKTSKVPTFQRMWSFMSQHPSALVSTTQKGIDKVKRGNYAFLMGSRIAEFIRMHNCDLMQVGGLLDDRGYGVGTQNGSPYRERISLAILHLHENGVIQQLEEKWWNKTGCRGEKREDMTPLGLEHVGGVFLVLIIGLILSVIVAVAEYVWRCSRKFRKP